jgi:hypothetical protein
VVALDAEERAHAREQLRLVERLGHEVVGARLDRGDLLLVAARRDHHHGEEAGRFGGPDGVADLVAVHPGHEDVEQDEVDGQGGEPLERLGAGRGGDDGVAARGEHRLEQPDVLHEVVDHEDGGGLVRHVSAPGISAATWRGSSRTSMGFSR